MIEIACKNDSDCDNSDCEYCTSNGLCRGYDSAYCDYMECGIGDGDCDSLGRCQEGLVCGENNFLKYHPLLSLCQKSNMQYAEVCIEPGIC